MPRKPPNEITAYATLPLTLSIITRCTDPIRLSSAPYTEVPCTLSLPMRDTVSFLESIAVAIVHSFYGRPGKENRSFEGKFPLPTRESPKEKAPGKLGSFFVNSETKIRKGQVIKTSSNYHSLDGAITLVTVRFL